MIGRRRISTVRARLTLWNVGVMLLVLAVYAAGVFMFVRRSASLALDERVRSDFSWANGDVGAAARRIVHLVRGRAGTARQPVADGLEPGRKGPVADDVRRVVSDRRRAHGSRREASGRIEIVQSGSDNVPRAERRVAARRPAGRHPGRAVRGAMQLELRELVLFLALGLPLALLVAGVGGYLMARHALAPADRMAERARSISADRLSERLPVDNPHDEFGRLAGVFNDTLGRLDGVFAQMQRFTSDVSHELRTPLTAIRTVGEVGLRERRDERAYREIIGSMLEEVDRLVCLVTRLLTWSRIDSGQAKPSIETIDLSRACRGRGGAARRARGRETADDRDRRHAIARAASAIRSCFGRR